jgi:hypothetical protein
LPLLVSTISRGVLVGPPPVVPKSIEEGLNDKAGARTSTVTDLLTDPSLLLHDKLYVRRPPVVGVTVSVSVVSFGPCQSPEAVQLVAPVARQLNRLGLPKPTLAGNAVNISVGTAPNTFTVTVPDTEPAGPLQVKP